MFFFFLYLDLVDDHRQVGELDDGLRDRERQRPQARAEAADEDERTNHDFKGGKGVELLLQRGG